MEDKRHRDDGGEEKRDRKRKDVKIVPVKSVGGWVVLFPCIDANETENTLRDRLSAFGTIGRVTITMNNRTGAAVNSLVEFETASEAEAAIKASNGQAGFAFVD